MQHKTPLRANRNALSITGKKWLEPKVLNKTRFITHFKKLSLAFGLMSRHCRHWNLIYYLLEYYLVDSTFYIPLLISSLSIKVQESN